jgi:hypothetical protein
MTKAKCHGQYSIQREINNIIWAEYPKPEDWRPRIKSRRFRNAIKAELLRITTEWCDEDMRTCACEDRKPAFV